MINIYYNIIILSVLFQGSSATINNEKIFLDYCISGSLSNEQIKTLDSLKERYSITSCNQLYESLSQLEFISLRNKKIKDISVFKYFPALKRLGLDNNEIDDLSGLVKLDNITYLSLSDNQITDVTPLLEMNSLEKVFLDRNPIKKESLQCPISTELIDINEFCFDEQQFDSEFEKTAVKSNVKISEIRSIIDQIIHYSKIEEYYHFDAVAKRSPLQAYFNFDIPTKELDLEIFNKEVVSIRKPNDLALKIKIEIKGTLAIAKFIYPPEGIRGNFKMKEFNGVWSILKSHIYE